ncbi:MAG: hypothetical protein WAM58_00575, partial [Candidatus Acidiferrum sp.]
MICAATNVQQKSQKSGVSHSERIRHLTSTAEIYTPVNTMARGYPASLLQRGDRLRFGQFRTVRARPADFHQ